MILQFADREHAVREELLDRYRWRIGLLFAGLLLLLFVLLLLWLLRVGRLVGLVLRFILYGRLFDRWLLFFFRDFWLAIRSDLFVLLVRCVGCVLEIAIRVWHRVETEMEKSGLGIFVAHSVDRIDQSIYRPGPMQSQAGKIDSAIYLCFYSCSSSSSWRQLLAPAPRCRCKSAGPAASRVRSFRLLIGRFRGAERLITTIAYK